ncbi:hypothetical protein pdul_cds_122 [Pandoravirus dulcis]|uniref:F-box incomplete domain containing protein n=1 Tax=Pandoravirus dulcis TaxID=1349409 RepID=S4VVR5_9VIRU|nr:hypothetical protein pdul_cds_122 [Pandoravirus dulcis]AGO82034.1 hypothetical protein pdul_cds_122 [Pandoravirus dulcis]
MATQEAEADATQKNPFLQPELWTLILVGRHDSEPDAAEGVPPKWRFATRAVCRAWRDIVNWGAPSFWGGPSECTQACLWKHDRQVLWGRGRLVCASAFVDWAKTHGDGLTRAADVDALIAWIAAASHVADLDHQVPIIFAESGVPALVERALDMALALCETDADPATDHNAADESAWTPCSDMCVVPSNKEAWQCAPLGTVATYHPYVVAAAAVRSGRAEAIAPVVERMPRALMSRLAIQAAVANDDLGALQMLFALGRPSAFEALNAMLHALGPNIVAWCLDATKEPCGRPWACALAALFKSADHCNGFVIECIERTGSTRTDVRNVHAAVSAILDVCDAHGITATIDTDTITDVICERRSIGGAEWILRRTERDSGPQERLRVLGRLAVGACRLDGDSDRMSYSDDSDALLSWLCDGPPQYSPLAKGAHSQLDSLFLEACADHRADPRCFAWLCERWPEEAARMHPPWVASMMRATCDRVDDVKDAGEIERLFMALDAALVHAAAPTALVEAVDVWPLLFDRLERVSGQPGDPCAYVSATQLIQYVWRRCQGDVERHLVEPVLAAERAMTLFTIDIEARKPWRCTRADAPTWRRWCRVRPMRIDEPASDYRAAHGSFSSWLAERRLLL